MKSPFDRVVISSDENPMFIQFLPLVSKAWRKFFPEVKISLGLVSNSASLTFKCCSYVDDVFVVEPIEGVPNANLAKVLRYWVASQYPNDVCMIEDIDTVPLQREFFFDRASKREANKLLVVGREVYDGTPHEKKFPISTLTGEGSVFKNFINPHILNPEVVTYEGWIYYLRNFKEKFDKKENIASQPDLFSDESLWRVFLYHHILRDGLSHELSFFVNFVKRDVNIQEDWIDRSWFRINEEKLKAGKYVCANMPRPLEPNWDRVLPIIRYIYDDPNPNKQEVILNP